MGPKPPGGGKAPPPVPPQGRMGPETRAGLGDPAGGARATGSDGAIRWRAVVGATGLPLACAGAWGVRTGGRTPPGRDRGSGGERTRKKGRSVTVLPWGFRNSIDQAERRSLSPQFLDLVVINGAPGEIRTHDLCLRRAALARSEQAEGWNRTRRRYLAALRADHLYRNASCLTR
jgi:hypothetical protein